MSTANAKRNRPGRPSDYVKDHQGEPIVGLQLHASSGRYYTREADGQRRYFGKDYYAACVKFHEWKEGKQHTIVRIPETRTVSVADFHEAVDVACELLTIWPDKPPVSVPDWLVPVVQDILAGRPVRQTVVIHHLVKSVAFWGAVRDAILADPELAAQRTGLPLDRLHQFKPPAPSIPLADLLALWEQRSMTPRTRAYGSRYWREFCQRTKAITAADVTVENVTAYAEWVEGRHNAESIRQRYTIVKAVFNHGLKKGKDQEQVQRCLTVCKVLVKPPRNRVNPQPISRENFHKLLAVADEKWRAILLLSLNCGFYPIDIAGLKKADFNLDKQWYRGHRSKTGVPRVAVLWDRTAIAVRSYLSTHDTASEYLFLTERGSNKGKPYKTSGVLSRRFKKLALAAHCLKVEFAHLRDGTQTAAIEGGADPVKADILMGHVTGMRDHYLFRNPGYVADACKAVEAYYFGPDNQQSEAPQLTIAKAV